MRALFIILKLLIMLEYRLCCLIVLKVINKILLIADVSFAELFSVVYKYYMVRGEVGRSIFPEVLATGLLPRTRRVRGNRPVASTEGKIDPLPPR